MFSGLLILVVVPLFSAVENKSRVEIKVLPDIMAAYFDPFMFGTEKQMIGVEFSFGTPEANVADLEYENTYGKCHNYCSLYGFCNLYCSPMCCIASSWTKRKQSDLIHSYAHNSTKLRVSKKYWRSRLGSAVGVWAEDQVFIPTMNRGTLDLQVMPFALKVIDAFHENGYGLDMGQVGLGRDPERKNFVQILKERGFINDLLFTVVYRRPHRLVFGDYGTENCAEARQEINVIGDREWMFDAIGVDFFSHKSDENYRMILIANSNIYMPRQVIVSMTNSGFFIPVNEQTQGNVYRLNFTQLDWKTELSFEIKQDVSIKLPLEAFGAAFEFSANPLDPNPDNVQWMVGGMFYTTYCVTFDQEHNKVIFAKLKR